MCSPSKNPARQVRKLQVRVLTDASWPAWLKSSHSNRWYCALNDDKRFRACEAPQEPEDTNSLQADAFGQREGGGADAGRQKGGRELRPLRPAKVPPGPRPAPRDAPTPSPRLPSA